MFELRNHAVSLLGSLLQMEPDKHDGGLITARCLEVANMLFQCLSHARAYALHDAPHLVITPDCELRGNERYLGDDFRLPSEFVYVEDPCSGVLLGDLAGRQVGTKPSRVFLSVESFEAARVMQSQNPPSYEAALAYEQSMPPQSVRLVFGNVGDVQALSLDPSVSPLLQLTFLDLLVLSPSGVSTFESPPTPLPGWTEPTHRIRPEQDLPSDLRWMASVTSAIACAYKEIAWLRAVRS